MYLPGSLTISRVHSSHDGDYVEIRIDDDASGCEVVCIKCSLLAFSEALMAHGFKPCEFELRTKHVGKVREIRDITVPRPEIGYKRGDDEDAAGLRWIKKHAKAELVDGWEPHHPPDVFNSHRWTKEGKGVRVGLIRFVDAKPESTDANPV